MSVMYGAASSCSLTEFKKQYTSEFSCALILLQCGLRFSLQLSMSQDLKNEERTKAQNGWQQQFPPIPISNDASPWEYYVDVNAGYHTPIGCS